MSDTEGQPSVPAGFRMAGVYSGVKRNPNKLDLSLIVSDRPATASGVYTQNLVRAAPVELDRGRTPNDHTRAVVVNSGNANACTGDRGMADARQMCQLAADACELDADQVLVMSTGIIGEFLRMNLIAAGIRAAAEQLADDDESLTAAARGMLTTDSVPKIFGQRLDLPKRRVAVTGMAKGAAMIGPNMATMLGLVLTDAPLPSAVAQKMLSEIVDDTFNCIHVDGHTSTNDTVLLLANGASGGGPLDDFELDTVRDALHTVCAKLARSIPADGEGAAHLITIDVQGCSSTAAARTIAKTIANSPLVKTAVAGADPNWGRIVSAAGYAGVTFDPKGVDLHVNDYLLFRDASPVAFDAEAVSNSIRDNRDVSIVLTFSEGSAKARFWTTDLTEEYVRLNADYHT